MTIRSALNVSVPEPSVWSTVRRRGPVNRAWPS